MYTEEGFKNGIGGKKVETKCLTPLSKSFAVKGSRKLGAITERGNRVKGRVVLQVGDIRAC